VLIKVYPDIKWDFHFYLNLSNDLSVKWSKLSPDQHKAMQKMAGKIGAEKSHKQTDIDFGVVMEVNWDKAGDKYGSKLDVTLKHEAKIKQLYKVFSSLKDFAKVIGDTTKGKVNAVGFTFKVLPPNFCLGAIWNLERGKDKNGKETKEIGTYVDFYFKADPLIAAEFTIDLLQVIVAAAGTATGNPEAVKIFQEVRAWLAEDGHFITFTMNIDLVIKGVMQGDANITFNTASFDKKMEANLSATLSVELKAGMEVEGKLVIIGVEAYAKGEMKASGKAAVTFGHGLKYNNEGMFYRPKLMFDGLLVTAVIKAEVGLNIKRGIFKGKRNMTLADYNYKNMMIPEFDVIKSLETAGHFSADMALFKE
jgi:hypothetical protein